jgi:predicted unusual protein kinase regulating ubiquinone biosynthesis (AarF/ABC1/UbiB family)
VNAASIGQVHVAMKTAKKLAVKINILELPIVSLRILHWLNLLLSECLIFKVKIKYFKEVEDKLIEETNYLLGIRTKSGWSLQLGEK